MIRSKFFLRRRSFQLLLRHLCVAVLFCFTNLRAAAQSDSAGLRLGAYAELYYAYDFGQPEDHERPGFIYSFDRHNEVNLNLGLLRADYGNQSFRASLALGTGTYMNANMAAEPGVLKNLFEGTIGVSLARSGNWWIDAGVFASHIGFESAVGKDNWTLTRSMMADNSPYYESGVKVSYTSENKKWLVSGLFLNGWQRITRPSGYNTPAFGHQLTYRPDSRWTINSSSFVGSDRPDSANQLRFFHDLYVIAQLTERFGITGGFDIGAEQKPDNASGSNWWYAPILIGRYQPAERHTVCLRFEYYKDEYGVIIPTGTKNGFDTWGASVNYDFAVREKLVWRTEARTLRSTDPIFMKGSDPVSGNFCITTSLAFRY